MIYRTVNGEKIWWVYIEKTKQYYISYQGDSFFSIEKPVTDQDVELIELQLIQARNETKIARFFIQNPNYLNYDQFIL